jgi:two-component system nitrate/nitrite response regulator NarL
MSGSGAAGRTGVVIASELALVAEVVRAGLTGRDFEATTLRWPGELQPGVPGSPPRAGQHVGLLISDLDSWPRLRATWLLMAQVRLPWVVLTTAPYGPMWGAVLEAGARVVLPSSTRLVAVCDVVVGAARGSVHTLPAERELLVGLWADLRERRDVIGQRVETLTPRENDVLTMLHAGDPVARIAQLLEVSPATVRSQVKAVLRKLQVNTQLGAVAALDDLLELEPMEPARPCGDLAQSPN